MKWDRERASFKGARQPFDRTPMEEAAPITVIAVKICRRGDHNANVQEFRVRIRGNNVIARLNIEQKASQLPDLPMVAITSLDGFTSSN